MPAEVLIDSGAFKKLLTIRKDFKKTDETLKTYIYSREAFTPDGVMELLNS